MKAATFALALCVPVTRAWVAPSRPLRVAAQRAATTDAPAHLADADAAAAAAVAAAPSLGEPVCVYHELRVPTARGADAVPAQEVTVADLTPHVAALVKHSGVREGSVTVCSRHTTTALTINEWESRLVDDVARWLLELAPPDDRSEVGRDGAGVSYFHNDIDVRPDSADERERCLENGWAIDDPAELQRWRDQEPINAHSHLLAMLLGSTECIPVSGGRIVLGQWQSVMLVDLDGPRDRTVGLQVTGYK